MADGPRVAAIVLAAGESTRMGAQKAMLPWGATTLVAYQIGQMLEAGVAEVIVVTGYLPDGVAAEAGRIDGVTVAHNAGYADGKAGSIVTGLRALPADTGAIVLLGVDQPRPAAIVRRLLDAHAGAGARITVPVRAGRRGHPVIFDASLLPELLAITDATQGIRAVMGAHAADVLDVVIDDAAIHLDLNTPGDLASANG